MKGMTLREIKGNTQRYPEIMIMRSYEEDDIEGEKREYPEIEIISDQKRQRHETVARPRRPG